MSTSAPPARCVRLLHTSVSPTYSCNHQVCLSLHTVRTEGPWKICAASSWLRENDIKIGSIGSLNVRDVRIPVIVDVYLEASSSAATPNSFYISAELYCSLSHGSTPRNEYTPCTFVPFAMMYKDVPAAADVYVRFSGRSPFDHDTVLSNVEFQRRILSPLLIGALTFSSCVTVVPIRWRGEMESLEISTSPFEVTGDAVSTLSDTLSTLAVESRTDICAVDQATTISWQPSAQRCRVEEHRLRFHTAVAACEWQTVADILYASMTDSIGTMSRIVRRICNAVAVSLAGGDLEIPSASALLSSAKGVLLHGVPGSGKSFYLKALQETLAACGIEVAYVHAPSIRSHPSGDGSLPFQKLLAGKATADRHPRVILIDEIDAIAAAPPSDSKVFGRRILERRLMHSLLSFFDTQTVPRTVIVGCSTSPGALDPLLVSAHRFGQRVNIALPTVGERLELLRGFVLEATQALGCGNGGGNDGNACRWCSVEELMFVAERAHGFSPADLENVVRTAVLDTIQSPNGITQQPVQRAFERSRGPSSIGHRRSLRSLHPVRFADLVGLDAHIHRLRACIVDPLIRRYKLHAHGETAPHTTATGAPTTTSTTLISTSVPVGGTTSHTSRPLPRGVLIHGPSGTGKTALAAALAVEARVNVIAVQGPDLLSKVFGDSEAAVARVFEEARACAPCFLLIDQFEALARDRGTSGAGAGTAGDRVLSTFLIELDGIHGGNASDVSGGGDPVILVATTNRFDLLDPAVCRAGRLDIHVEIDLPSTSERRQLWQHFLGRVAAADDCAEFVEELVQRSNGFSGADIDGAVREAAMAAVRGNRQCVERDDLRTALRMQNALADLERLQSQLCGNGGDDNADAEDEE